jgi:hypothetical protein
MAYQAQTALAEDEFVSSSSCDDVQTVSADFRFLIIEQCPRCAGSGPDCMMEKINEVAFEPEGSA